MDDLVTRLRSLHKPFGIYDECGHEHPGGTDEPGVFDCLEVGFSCLKIYDICFLCCTNGDEQTEACFDYHNHGPSVPICASASLCDEAANRIEELERLPLPTPP